jgi:hypothetical protein
MAVNWFVGVDPDSVQCVGSVSVRWFYLESIPESWILPGWEIQIFYFLKNPAASFQIFD